MTLQELGEALRSAREKRELSLEDVAAYLKLSTGLIKAIEEGDIAVFPHIVYAKGFIKSYASMMNIAQEEVAQAIAPYAAQNTMGFPVHGHKQESAKQSASELGVGTLAAVLFVLLAGLIFLFRQPLIDKWQEITQSDGASSDTVSQIPNSPDSFPANPATPSVPIQPSISAQPASSQPPAQDTATAAAVPQEQTPASTEQPALPTTTEKQSSQDKHELVIVANKICWLNARPSTLPPKGRLLQRGERLAIPFEKRITLRLGNASAVSLFYDGEEWPLGSQKAKVVLTFPPEN